MADAFNLLQMYQDDDDDDDIEDATTAAATNQTDNHGAEERESAPRHREEPESRIEDLNLNDVVFAVTPVRQPSANSTPKTASLRPPTPQQVTTTVVDTTVVSVVKVRRAKTAIVDYGHDDVAMSPEPEEGEIAHTSSGGVMFGEELGNTRDAQEGTPVPDLQTRTPNNKVDSPQLGAPDDVLPTDLKNNPVKDSETDIQEGIDAMDEDRKDVDALDKFLPPPPQDKCSDELQEKINKFLAYKRQGKSFNVEVRNRKDYRNPDFLRHAVRYQDIDEIGSCFSKDVFDPHGYDESDFYDAIEAAINRERERKGQERKKSPKVEFVAGSTQAGTVGIAQKVMLANSGVSNLSSGGLQSSSIDVTSKEGGQNKKSKWDKVDGDRRNLLSGGHDNVSTIGARAALLSAGAGYAMYAQQNRLETEEKRTSDKRLDRRS